MMPKQYLIRFFIKFLKCNQVYNSYLFHLKETKGRKKSKEFIIRSIMYKPDNLIISAFNWVTPKQQKKSWSELHSEWVKFLDKNGYNIYSL